MGVHGLWKLIEPAGKPVPLESLENKVLAVDVSIWLYQLTKGLQTTGGSAVPNAHLLGLFNRICKLLYYRIKPVFVFDGGVPLLKKETIEARKRQKRKAQDNSEQLREKLLNNLLKQRAVNEFLGNDEVPSSSQIFDDMFVLPPLPEENIDDPDSESDTEITTAKIESFCDFQYGKDLHSIDIKSEQFKSLPAEIRHEILSELIETKKQNSWAKIHEMPERSQDFSKFQLERLKKRRDVQVSLDSAAKEMGGRSLTLNELEAMFQEDGIVTDNLRGQRIVGDNVTRFVYITGKSKEKKSPEKSESVNENEQKTKEKKEVTKVEETSINVKKHEEISIRKKSSISDAEFQKNIQTIEDCVFVKDFSSDEEFDAMDETHDSEYIRTLLDKEKISQDEIFNIIKQEQNLSNNSSLSIVESDIDDKIDSCVEAVPNTCPDDDIIQPTQTYEQSKSKLFLLINQSNKSIVENDDTCGSCNVESKSLLDENEPSQSRSVELFPDDDFEPEGNFVDYLEQKNHSDELPQTVMLPKRDCVSVQNEHISEPKSVELFSDSDSDDFIEVSNDEQSSYFKKFNKEIEISINPNDITQNDIFSDVFNPGSLDDTVILDKNESNQFVSPLLPEPSKPSLGVSNSSNEESNENKFVENIASEKSLENSETKPAKLANIFDKIKKAENIMKKNVSEGKTNSSTESESPRKKELLKEVQEMLNNEQNELSNERAKQERFGSSITQQMIIEAQELLQLFGLPYVVAPMEAEAQCAFLDKISLTEGTITDDSDIWLFGGQKVYKNFFDHRKYVLQFRAIDIEHFFKLSREQLIQMALLVGSDYTVGIEGVGPVTALEILAYFSDVNNKPTSKSDIAETLKKFRLWLKSNRSSSSPLSKKCKNVNLSEAFPSTTVIEAYLFPTVDESKESFTWATPDLDQIRSYMRSKFGWKSTRIDDILLPVMKRLNDTNKQTTLDQFFKSKPFSAIEFGGVSKRVIQAINVMKSKTEEEPLQTPSTSKSPAKKVTKNTVKRTRRSSKKTPLKRTPTALPVYKSSQGMKKVAAPYFGEVIPQKEKDKMDAAKRKLDAIKVFQAQNKNKKKARKNKVLPAKPDSSYLSESSSDDNN